VSFDGLLAMRLERRERGALVAAHEQRIAHHVGRDDRCESPVLPRQGAAPYRSLPERIIGNHAAPDNAIPPAKNVSRCEPVGRLFVGGCCAFPRRLPLCLRWQRRFGGSTHASIGILTLKKGCELCLHARLRRNERLIRCEFYGLRGDDCPPPVSKRALKLRLQSRLSLAPGIELGHCRGFHAAIGCPGTRSTRS
jgi:hypothetical protein